MKYVVISDIHSNLEALRALLAHIKNINIDKIICCGDLVGYYSNPNECIELLIENKVDSILGNHDMAAIGSKSDLSSFWDVARKAIIWTKSALSNKNKKVLKELPTTSIIDNKFLLFHGSLHAQHNPEDLHLTKHDDILATMKYFIANHSKLNIAFYGHTHIDAIYSYEGDRIVHLNERNLILEKNKKYLINPGSLGQPRDGDPRASYLIYDDVTRRIEFHRLQYNKLYTIVKAAFAGLWLPRSLRRFIRILSKSRNILSKFLFK